MEMSNGPFVIYNKQKKEAAESNADMKGKEIDVKMDRIKIPFLLVKLYPTADTVLPGSQGNFPWRQAAEDLHLLQ